MTALNLLRNTDNKTLSATLGVTERSIRRYKSGASTPPRGFLELIELKGSGRVIPASWPHRMHFRDGHLIAHRQSLNAAQIDQLGWITQQWQSTAANASRLIKQVKSILPFLPADIAHDISFRIGVIEELTTEPVAVPIRPL